MQFANPMSLSNRRRAPRAAAVFARKRMSEAVRRASVVFLLGAAFGMAAGLPLKARAQSTPYTSAIAVPGTFKAERFDKGGEGVAYHDRTSGNAGGKYRPGEGVDIIVGGDGLGYVINNFQTGEWLAYTINVAGAGDYDIHLRAASTFANSAFHVKIDGQDVTGPVTVPNTGGWSSYQWVGRNKIRLTSGKHVLKVFSNQQYFNLDEIRVRRSATTLSRPYSGSPIVVPKTFQAEHYDVGGEGVAYHDKDAQNSGGVFRAGQGVDIITAGGGNGRVLNSFRTGEWVAYTIQVPKAGRYDIGLLASSAMSGSAFRATVDGKGLTGIVAVPNTGGWSNFRWVDKKGVTLAAGRQVLKIHSAQQYFNLNKIRIRETGSAASGGGGGGTPDTGNRQFFCTFANSPSDCGFFVQQKAPGRATIVNIGRDGGTAVKLRTLPGDNNVAGSGSENERNDLSLSTSATDCSEGKEAWWAHSVRFPDDYNAPPNGYGVVMDFHHTGSGGQANFHVDSDRWDGRMHLRGYGGSQDQNHYEVVLGTIKKNVWYDFVHHVRWSSGSDGFMRSWLNGKKVLDHRGPTLYAGERCYLKLANYHSAFGQATSVIHDRVIRGSTPGSVALTPLEGVND